MAKKRRFYAHFILYPKRSQELVEYYFADAVQEFTVVRVVDVDLEQFGAFLENIQLSHPFLGAEIPDPKGRSPFRCVLVRSRSMPDSNGILVVPGPGGRVNYAAYAPRILPEWLEGI